MKKKLLLCLAISVSSMSINSFALEIHKGRIISQKQWSTDNIKVNFKDTVANHSEKNQIEMTPGTDIHITSQSSPAQGNVGTTNYVSGINTLFIRNETDTTQSYIYRASSCVQTSAEILECGHYDVQFELEPNGTLSQNESPVVQIIFNAPGQYETFNATVISTAAGNQYIHSASNSFITVL